VDDEPAVAKLATLIFRPPHFNCTAVESATQALAKLQSERFDVVVSDLTMPRIDGLEFLNRVRVLYPLLPFLVTTGVDDVEIGVHAMRSGADDYLVKPLLESAVLASVERALRRRLAERELENYRQRLEEMVAIRTEELESALE
jgi:DNA-binding NtrC family response regulator